MGYLILPISCFAGLNPPNPPLRKGEIRPPFRKGGLGIKGDFYSLLNARYVWQLTQWSVSDPL